MKKFLLATVALASISAPALAADLGARPYYNNAPAYAAPIYNWTGFYIGGHIGGAFSGSNSFNGLVLNDHNSRLMGGVQAGADWQFAPNWVLGVEGQYSWLGSNNVNAVFPGGFFYNNDQRAIGSITGRVGWTWGPGLVYVKGGYAFSDNNRDADPRRPARWLRARSQPPRRLHHRCRRGIHVRAELVGQGRVSILQFRRQPLSGPDRAGAVRQLPK